MTRRVLLVLALALSGLGCVPCLGPVAAGGPAPTTALARRSVPAGEAVPLAGAAPAPAAVPAAVPSPVAPALGPAPATAVATAERPSAAEPAPVAPPSAAPIPATLPAAPRAVPVSRAAEPSASRVAVNPARPAPVGRGAARQQLPGAEPASSPSAGPPPFPAQVAQGQGGAGMPGSPPPSAAPSPAQNGAQGAGEGGAIRVYLVTMGPGDLVWEKFGHNALWVVDPATGIDDAYNYGLFDFAQENFVSRFIQGRMLYWMQGIDGPATLRHYLGDNRDVWVQELNLAPAQKVALRDFLRWNEREENRFYRYDYYRDNCSTRVRDALDRVLGGTMRAQFDTVPTGTTYRSHTARLTASSVAEYSGLMVGLGPAADRPITAWEEMFLPLKVRDRVRTLTTAGPDGRPVPLVLSERHLPSSGRETERDEPPNRIPWYLLGGVLLGAAFVGLGRAAPRSGAARFGFAALSGVWLVLVALGGVVLAGLWGWTDHAIAYRNENLFQFDPLAIPLVLLVPCLAYGARWAARPAALLMLAVAALAVLGFVLQVLPGLDQTNGEIIALALPAHLGLAWAVLRLRDAVLGAPGAASAGRASAKVA